MRHQYPPGMLLVRFDGSPPVRSTTSTPLQSNLHDPPLPTPSDPHPARFTRPKDPNQAKEHTTSRKMIQSSTPQGVESTLLGAAVIRGLVDPQALIHPAKIIVSSSTFNAERRLPWSGLSGHKAKNWPSRHSSAETMRICSPQPPLFPLA